MKNSNFIINIITGFVLLLSSTWVLGQSYQFATKIEAVSSLDMLVVRSVDTDANGNSYATGYFEGTVNAPNGTIPSTAGSQDIFISKFDSNGSMIWFRNAGGNTEDGSNDISVETFGNGSFYITGYVTFGSAVTFYKQVGTIILTAPLINSFGQKQGFVAKYDLNGHVIWARPIQTNTSYNCNIAQESEGISLVASYRHTNGLNMEKNVYVTGYFSGDLAHFQNSNGTYKTITGHGGSLISPCGFTAKFMGSNGGNMWVQSMASAGSGFSMGKSIDIGNHQNFQPGRIYVMGDFSDNGNFGGTQLSNSSGNIQSFLYSANGANGNGYWANQFIGNGGDANAREISIEQSNDNFVCAIGDFRGSSISYSAGGSGNNSGGRDIFITKINATSGSINIFKVFGGNYDQYGSGIVRARNSGLPDVYISGVFNQQLTFDNGQQINTQLTGQFENDHFFARLDNNLDLLCYDSWQADLLLDLNYGELRIDANKVGLTKSNDQSVIGGMFFDSENPTFNFTTLSSSSTVGSFVSHFACCDCPPPLIDVQRDPLGTDATLSFTYANCSNLVPNMFNFYFQALPNGQVNPLGLPWGTTTFTMSNLMPFPTMYKWFTSAGCVNSTSIIKSQNISENTRNGTAIKAVPNPTEGVFEILVETSERVEAINYKVFDQLGRIVIEGQNVNAFESSKIDLTEFESGIYLIQVAINDKTEILRIVKQ